MRHGRRTSELFERDPSCKRVGFRNSSGRGSATVGSFVESGEGGSFAVVVCVPGGAGSARARFAVGAFASVEGAGDLGVAARVGCSATSVGSAEVVAGGSCFSGCVEPHVAARGVGLLLGEAGDVVGLAPPACRSPLDVREYGPGAVSARLVGRSFDPSVGEGESTLGVPPTSERAALSWRAFLRQHAATTLACDFLTVETAFLQRIYVLFCAPRG